MEALPDRIFISYSRADGREFAEAFERRLEQEGIRSWRDLKSMEAGDIRPQVLQAIEHAKHFVLILSRQALTSCWIKREWSHARLMGKRVSPVLADPTLAQPCCLAALDAARGGVRHRSQKGSRCGALEGARARPAR
jgi:hypothetical protein